ncbi:hypothetical protein OG884_09180 [Streptosporangium sp. NBC_01755]|uniref:hypothetical protein n=1 Tax=Streptosporangium sp. NBC_01755 TaxID=2975949 RepID=UPI002DD8D384|nr:hypothetical protein [Streptosporangium sp. NBC_01755]WSD02064.1 hypothetical protein OG884_09180 [Streptosporangium sp. NBC_01755]
MAADLPAWAVRLREERRNRLWPQREMARRLVEAADEETRNHLPTRETMIRRIKAYEAGHNRPGDPYRVLYARAFGIPEAELFREERQVVTGAIPTFARAFPASPNRYVAPELVDYFCLQLLSHYAADAFLGPRHLIGTVVVQYQSIAELAGQAKGEVQRELLRLGAGFAAFAGWLCQDAGVTDQAALWLNANLEMAHRAQDAQLISHALTNKAMLAVDLGDASAVIDLTAAALSNRAGLMPKTQVLALQQRAHGYALAADRTRCDALLDEAATLIDDIDDDHMWGNACRTPNYVEIQRATCYGRLGLNADAVTLWDQILPSMPATARRDIGVFLARQGAALAAIPDPERATEVASKAIELLRQTGSVRQRAELIAMPARMGAWVKTAKGREMTEMLANVTQ